MLLPATIASVLVLGTPVPFGVPQTTHQASSAEIQARFEAAEKARTECRWEEAAAHWRVIRAGLPRGDGDWFVAGSQLTGALSEIWTEPARDELMLVARDTLAEAKEHYQAHGRRALGSGGAGEHSVADYLVMLRKNLAAGLQGQGLHAEALGHLWLAIRDIESGHAAFSEYLLPRVKLDVAACLLELGRVDEARAALIELRDAYPGALEGAMAAVLLEPREAPWEGYRGSFEADRRFRSRSEELMDALPRARRLVADWIGAEASDLPIVWVGFAEPLRGRENIFAFAKYELRRPAIPPIVVFSAHQVALGLFDLERILVHELSHAVLWLELGPRYERLPIWIHESLARSLSGELEGLLDTVLAVWVLDDWRQFLRPTLFEERRIEIDGRPCPTTRVSLETQLAGFWLQERAGGPGAPALVRELVAGKDLEEALLAACGQGLTETLEAAARRAREKLEERWTEVRPAIASIERFARKHPSIFVAVAKAGLPSDAPEIVRELTLRRRAECLEVLGRLEEAAAAWRDLLELAGPCYDHSVHAQMGEVRCLLAVSGPEEARSHLERLQREGLRAESRAWAAARIAELAPPEAAGSERDD